MQAVNTFSNVPTQYSDTETSSVGNIKANVAAALCYFGPFGIIFLFLEKQNRLVRFHAVQSLLNALMIVALMIVGGVVGSILALALGYIEPILGAVAYGLVFFALIGYAIGAPVYSMIAAFRGKRNQLPVIGRFAERAANK